MTGQPPAIWRRRHPREPDQVQGYTQEAAELTEKRQGLLQELTGARDHGEGSAGRLKELEQELVAVDEQLRALHAHVAQMQRHLPNQQLQPTLLAEQCLAAARQLVGEEWQKREGTLPEGHRPGEVAVVQELLAGCLAVLFGLHDTARRPVPEVHQVMQRVMAKVKPEAASSMSEYYQIDALAQAMVLASTNQMASMGGGAQ